jgi:LytS/YehU family sensor histidine kinase
MRDDFFIIPLFIPIPIFLGIGLWIYEQWKWIQNLKSGKREAELSLLRSQINPHFFFNTLNNLYALTITKSDQAPEVILKLSDMMRYTIYEGEKETVKLLDEITYLENYIELHKIRYKKSVEISFNHSVDTSLKVAPLLFILLLENAFKHGIESLSENAFIHIDLYEDSKFIYFDIENNFEPNTENESTGIGLNNLKKRLSLLYKGKHEYSVDATDCVYKTKLKIAKDA